MSNARKILIIDDDDELRESLSEQLSLHEEFDTVLAATGQEGLKQARNGHVDLVLLDVGLPDLDGREACKLLRRGGFKGPVVMLTAQTSDADTILGLESGANDYVTKPFSCRELLARVKAVIRRRTPQLDDEVIEVAGIRLDPAAHTVSINGRDIDLWSTEFRLLQFLITHPGRVYTRARLLDDVWGDHVFVEERTVDVHIRRLRLALAPSGHDSRIETVRGIGYRFVAGPTAH